METISFHKSVTCDDIGRLTNSLTVTKRLALKKQTQKPSSITERLRALSETESEDDKPFVFRKRKVAPRSNETYAPQVKKVKPTQQAR